MVALFVGSAIPCMLATISKIVENSMTVESLPKFTPPAAKLYAAIPAHVRKQLLSNVWCGACHHEVTITDFSSVVRSGNLLLVGKCSECHGDVARVIES